MWCSVLSIPATAIHPTENNPMKVDDETVIWKKFHIWYYTYRRRFPTNRKYGQKSPIFRAIPAGATVPLFYRCDAEPCDIHTTRCACICLDTGLPDAVCRGMKRSTAIKKTCEHLLFRPEGEWIFMDRYGNIFHRRASTCDKRERERKRKEENVWVRVGELKYVPNIWMNQCCEQTITQTNGFLFDFFIYIYGPWLVFRCT